MRCFLVVNFKIRPAVRRHILLRSCMITFFIFRKKKERNKLIKPMPRGGFIFLYFLTIVVVIIYFFILIAICCRSLPQTSEKLQHKASHSLLLLSLLFRILLRQKNTSQNIHTLLHEEFDP